MCVSESNRKVWRKGASELPIQQFKSISKDSCSLFPPWDHRPQALALKQASWVQDGCHSPKHHNFTMSQSQKRCCYFKKQENYPKLGGIASHTLFRNNSWQKEYIYHMGLQQTSQDLPLGAEEGLASSKAHSCPVAFRSLWKMQEKQLWGWPPIVLAYRRTSVKLLLQLFLM